jgi:hypothetical protein
MDDPRIGPTCRLAGALMFHVEHPGSAPPLQSQRVCVGRQVVSGGTPVVSCRLWLWKRVRASVEPDGSRQRCGCRGPQAHRGAIERSRAELSRTKLGQGVPMRAETSRADPYRSVAWRGEPSRAEPSRAEPSRVEPSRVESSRAAPCRTEPGTVEPCRAAQRSLWAPVDPPAVCPACRSMTASTVTRLQRHGPGLRRVNPIYVAHRRPRLHACAHLPRSPRVRRPSRPP